ncbi:E3 ubiquitin-protein ligase TRIM39 isoform X1 [Brachyistius frenatus]|uniref:E3 ubiquitin-protein ligase TRIM39 isoform X1 n=1 Tax=Brachyistius frenatus TaxID=100188 RepID=UPI0037E7420C
MSYAFSRISRQLLSGMATTGNLSEEQVHCSICLDVFTSPVSIPCGHNFCQGCILGYWKTSPLYQCPMCKKSFYKRPDISVNHVLREIAEQFKEIRVKNADGKRSGEERDEKTMERRKKEDEERLLEKDQRQQLLEELKQKQKQEKEKEKEKEEKQKQEKEKEKEKEEKEKEERSKREEKQGEKRSPQEELPALIPPTSAPKTSPPLSPQVSALRPPPPPPQTSPPPSPQIPAAARALPSLPSSVTPPPSWEEVLCDVCLGEGRPKAVKSCLVCLTSFCEEHLKSHAARFTKHKLIEPVANMEDRMCPKHQRLLELFCKKDQTCVCVLCTETDHRAHYTVPVEREWTDKKAQLKRTEIDVQQMIQDRVKKVEEVKHSLELNKASAQREIEESMQVFSELVRSIQRTQAELVLVIEEKQRQTERRAEGLVAELQQEITELQRRNTDLENVARTDHIHFLKSFPALITPPAVKDWSETSVPTDTCVGMIRRSVSKVEAALSDVIDKLSDSEIKRILKYSVDVILDPDTANPWLQLSQDRHQVRHLGAWQDLPDNADRFDTVVIVLGREGFTSGRHYWEVQVGDKDDWYLGVAKSSVNRKGRISVSTAQGYWALAMKKGHGYRVSTSPPLPLSLDPKPRRVGVYVDYEEGQVSFYDVRARTHIYTLEDTFTEKIMPFFYLYCCDKASDTMVICAANEKSLIKQS